MWEPRQWLDEKINYHTTNLRQNKEDKQADGFLRQLRMQTLQNSSFRENYFKTKGEQKHTQQVNNVIVIQISTWLTRQISKDGVHSCTLMRWHRMQPVSRVYLLVGDYSVNMELLLANYYVNL